MINSKEVKISEIFDFPSIKGLTANFISKNSGDIPVYGGRKLDIPIGYIENNLPNVKYFNDCLGWNREGSVGYVFYHKGFFSTNDHHRPLIVKKEYEKGIHLDYIKNILQILLFEQGFVWSKTASKEKVQKLYIKIPIKINGEFDLEKQKEIALKYEKLQKVKNRIRIMKEDIDNQKVKLEKIGSTKDISINELFDLKTGKSMYTRAYGDNNRGDFPVYSAGREKLTLINTFDFDGEYLTWSTNGFAGYLKRLDGKFSLNADRGIFIKKNKLVDINFINYSIATDLRNLTKGRIGDKGKNEFTKLSPKKIEDNIFVKIPIKENGEYDLEKQKEIAEKYKEIEKIKNNLIQELEYLEKVKVEI